MKKRQTLLLLSGVLALSMGLAGPLNPVAVYGEEQQVYDYADFVQKANEAIARGDLTLAIQLLEKAQPMAPDTSISAILNNLAAVYMKRGNYYHERQKQDTAMLSDFRRAYYLLEYAWPEGMERKKVHEDNRRIARENLQIGYTNLKISPTDKAVHLKLAKELRLQGKFQEAIVEYGRVLDLEKDNADAAKGMGDLFNVLSLPDKSKKYYAKAVNSLGGPGKEDLLVQLANAQNKSGDVNGAIANLNKALEVNPTNSSALSLLETIWKTEVRFNPASVLGHANLAGVYQKMKRYDEAIGQYNAAEHFASLDPKTSLDVKKLIRLNLGTLFQELKKYDQALNAYDTVLQVDRRDVLATYNKATVFRDAGQTDEALRWYHNVLSLDANHEAAHHDLIELIERQADPQKVALGLKTYADRFPQNFLVQSKVGEEFHRLKDFDNAAVYYQRALTLKPDSAAVYANLGAVFQAQGKQEDSLTALRKASSLDPKNETVQKLTQDTQQVVGYQHFQKAAELQQAGKYEESLEYLKKALQVAPNSADFHSAYGIALQHTNRLPEAVAEYQKAISLDANNANYPYYLGTAYHQQQQLDKALAAYKKAVSLDKNQQEAQQAIQLIEQAGATAALDKAVDAYNRKQYAQGLVLIGQALKTDPTNATAYYYKGLILNEQKQREGAIQSYREAIRHNPEFGDAYYALGVLLDSKKDTLGAKNAFQKFVELSKDTEDDFVKYAKQRLQAL